MKTKPIHTLGMTFLAAKDDSGTEAFLAGKKDDAKNTYVADFLVVAAFVESNYQGQTFSVNDFHALLKSKDIPPAEINSLFNGWSKRMLKEERLKKLVGLYDFDAYTLC